MNLKEKMRKGEFTFIDVLFFILFCFIMVLMLFIPIIPYMLEEATGIDGAIFVGLSLIFLFVCSAFYCDYKERNQKRNEKKYKSTNTGGIEMITRADVKKVILAVREFELQKKEELQNKETEMLDEVYKKVRKDG